VDRQADLVDDPVIDGQRLEPPGDQRTCLQGAARRADRPTSHHASIPRSAASSGAQFDEHLGLQFVEPAG